MSAGAERLRVALSGVRGCALTTGDPAEGLRERGRHAAAHQHINEVAHLRHQVGALVRTL